MEKIKMDSYEDKNGNKKYTAYVLSDEVRFLNVKRNTVTNEQVSYQGQVDLEKQDVSDPFSSFGEEINISDDELPFDWGS